MEYLSKDSAGWSELPDEVNFVPVVDCVCGQENMPLQTMGPTVTGEGIPETILYCPVCSEIPPSSDYKGYARIEDAELEIERILDEVL